MNLGIDLGTSRVVIYHPERKAVLLDEPAVIAVEKKTGRLIACGTQAEEMIGRTPPSLQAIRPIQQGVIADYEHAEKMLRYFLRQVCSNRIAKPCAAVSIPEEFTEVEQRSFIEAVISAGARRVTLVPETVAAAIGAGLDVRQPKGQMVVNGGGGTVDAAVLTLCGTAVSASQRGAGMAMDEAIIRYMRNRYNLLISQPSAERIKMAVGGALPREDGAECEARGRDALSGLPRVCVISSDEICEAMKDAVAVIAALTQQVLEVTPPELIGDVLDDGITLTGGLAGLHGLPTYLEQLTGIVCHVAPAADHCVAIGAGQALHYASSFSKVYDLGDYSYRLSGAVDDN